MALQLALSHMTATTESFTLSLHDALPISFNLAWSIARSGSRVILIDANLRNPCLVRMLAPRSKPRGKHPDQAGIRSEEHTSELQSRLHLVCRLLLEKKKTI